MKKILKVVIVGMVAGNSCCASEEAVCNIFEQPVFEQRLSPSLLLGLKEPYLGNMVLSVLDAVSNPQFMAKINQNEDTRRAISEKLALATRNQHIAEVKKMKIPSGEGLVNDATPDELQVSLERIERLYNDSSTSLEIKEALKDYVDSVANLVPTEKRYRMVENPDDVNDTAVIVFANILYGKMVGKAITEKDVYNMWASN
jgi:hypothetical protein